MARPRYAPDNLPRARHWTDDAACVGAPLGLFFPEGDSRAARKVVQEAKGLCEGCLVRERCLEEAMARGERYGVWGGLDERERRRLGRRGQDAERAALAWTDVVLARWSPHTSEAAGHGERSSR